MIRRYGSVNPRRTIAGGWRRGLAAQAARREHERSVRRRAVEAAQGAVRRGLSREEAAGALGVSGRTLRSWRHRAERDGLEARPRGRPASRSRREVRQEVLGVLRERGPSLGLPTLRPMFAGVSRAELARIVKRYRWVRRARYGSPGHRLTWHRAGAVWAMDFVDPPGPVDDVFSCVLSVCDLASGYQLLWQPMRDATAEAAVRALGTLFALHGPPLVLKSDNGSAFIAEATALLLAEWDVTSLFSPSRCPQYNGACERSNGILRTSTAEEAARQGHPGYWTCDDLELARQWSNQIRRPTRLGGRTPADVWDDRVLLSPEERDAFRRTVHSNRLAERAQRGHAPDEPLGHHARAAIDRAAVRDALCAHGHLTITAKGLRASPPPTAPSQPCLAPTAPAATVWVPTVPAESAVAEALPAEAALAEAVPAEPGLAEPVVTEPASAEPLPAEPVPAPCRLTASVRTAAPAPRLGARTPAPPRSPGAHLARACPELEKIAAPTCPPRHHRVHLKGGRRGPPPLEAFPALPTSDRACSIT